ncbi:MAG: hypothetical protein MZV70_66020 [Desulfobacterales bacterium]|nr:hypothetical protein [Desulfobacterales bacterium]
MNVGDKITGTATDGSNNTSEFGANFTVITPGISGTVFEDVNYGGGAGRNWATASGAVARHGPAPVRNCSTVPGHTSPPRLPTEAVIMPSPTSSPGITLFAW